MTDFFRTFVPVAFVEVIRDRLEKFSRRANAKGMPVPTLNLGEKQQRRTCSNGMHEMHPTCPTAEFIEVWMSGDTPRIGPWSLVASVDNVEGKPFFRPVPGQDVPERFRTVDPTSCEYCNVRNPRRTETFIVHNSETGEFKQVGRQCIKDFLGWNIDLLVSWYERIASIGDEPEGGWEGYIRPSFRPSEVINYAARIVSVDGRYIKAEFDRDSTKSKVWEFLSPPRGAKEILWYQEFIAKYNSQAELANRILNATMAALLTLDPDKSDWAYNVKTATDAEFIGSRQVGVVASAVILGLRAIEDEMNARRDEISGDKPSNEFIGNVGEKVSIPVTILDIRYMDNGYGSYLVQMADETGNSVKWFASNIDTSLNGKTVHITGTVKKHENYKGRNSTMLTRCKVEAF